MSYTFQTQFQDILVRAGILTMIDSNFKTIFSKEKLFLDAKHLYHFISLFLTFEYNKQVADKHVKVQKGITSATARKNKKNVMYILLSSVQYA